MTITVLNVFEEVVISDAETAANTLVENVGSGTVVAGLVLQAADEGGADLSSQVRWSLAQGSTAFAISTVGAITYASTVAVDYEMTPSYTIVVVGTVSRDETTVSGSLTVMVEVLNVLESIALLDDDNALNTITEGAGSGTAVIGLRLQAIDEGGDDVSSAVQWGLLQGSAQFAISTIGAITYASTAVVDYEMTSSYTVVVVGTVSRGTVTVSNDLTVVIGVADVLESIVLSDADATLNTLVEGAGSGTVVMGIALQAISESGVDVSSAVPL